VPALIALFRECENRHAIVFFNFLSGWTIVGWIVTFIWSCMDKRNDQKQRRNVKETQEIISIIVACSVITVAGIISFILRADTLGNWLAAVGVIAIVIVASIGD
jgi:heme/copper-type cytochrome/quinol oxidase subunit 2